MPLIYAPSETRRRQAYAAAVAVTRKTAEQKAAEDRSRPISEQRDLICEVARNPKIYKSDYLINYLTGLSIASQYAAATGTAVALTGVGAVPGGITAAAGVAGAVLAESTKVFVQLYRIASTALQRQMRPILSLLCEFPHDDADKEKDERFRSVYEIIYGLQDAFADTQNQLSEEDKSNMVETAKLNILIKLVEISMAEKAPRAAEAAGGALKRAIYRHFARKTKRAKRFRRSRRR